MDTKEMKVIIRRQPDDWKYGEISVDEISSPTWKSVSGGINTRKSFSSLYGKIPYHRAAALVSCSGEHAEYGNLAWVCLNIKDNVGQYAAGYKYLTDQIRIPRPIARVNRPEGQPPCTKKILQLLSDEPITRKELRNIVIDQIGYDADTVQRAIIRLCKQGKINLHGDSRSPNQEIALAKPDTE